MAAGILLIPKDLMAGEQRPVVVCQHGRNGLPQELVEGNNTYYNDVAAKLADQGFIVYVPQNPYRGEDRYRWLDRKANTISKTLFSFIISQHDQTPVSYTHLRAHETVLDLVCRLLLEKKQNKTNTPDITYNIANS